MINAKDLRTTIQTACDTRVKSEYALLYAKVEQALNDWSKTTAPIFTLIINCQYTYLNNNYTPSNDTITALQTALTTLGFVTSYNKTLIQLTINF